MDYENEFVKANNYALKCMRVAFIVLLLSWILNVLHIFIIDQTLMDRAFIGLTVCFALGYMVKYTIGFDKEIANYIMLFLLVAQITFGNVQLAYHGTLFMIFPMVCSVLYNEDKYKIYTFILTAVGFVVMVLAGYSFGLCDANMLLLTTTTRDQTAQLLLSGDFEINSDVVSLLLFYVFPRIMTLFAFNSVLNYIKNSIREKTMKEHESRRMAEAEKLANQAKSSFLANMSHEIRTPINTVLGLDTMILRESRDSNIRKYALNIQSAGHSLLSIINDILDFSKIESGKMEIIPVEYDMASLISDVTNMITPKAADKGLTLNIRADETIPVKLFGDDVRIRQVLINLLTNAVKYTPEGEVTLTVEWVRHGDDAVIHYSVKDTGIGIAKDDLEKLFEEFVRIEEKRNRNIEGTGLGINIVTMLLKLMGSKLLVDSVYGEGSDFHFTLVQRIVDDAPIGDIKERIASMADEYVYNAAYRLPEVSLLVVDDNAMNRLVFTELLKDLECDIDEADSGKKCLELVTDKKYDIIFMDHLMPQMDGIETLHHMQEMGDYINKDTPVIILTANAISGAKENYLEEGFDDFLSKPVDPDKLEKLVIDIIPDNKKVLVENREEDGNDGNENIDEIDIALPEVEGVDWDYALLKLKKLSILQSMVKDFIMTADDNISELKRLYEDIVRADYSNSKSNDKMDNMKAEEAGGSENIELVDAYSAYRIKVHAMKNNAATIGAIGTSTLAKLLENAAKNHDRKRLDSIMEVFEEDWNRLGGLLKDAFRVDEDAAADHKESVDRDTLDSLLHALSEAIDDLDGDTIDEIIKQLGTYKHDDQGTELLDKLNKAAFNMDYDEAMELIKEWKSHFSDTTFVLMK